ncbi:NADH-quinone oxidoreductase subunit L [Xylanibacillus composti]|uniref:NADH-quinone oxidoreductase subunit L n=1 Tax=Xylanibacillus composti TaxID=1572762 RepID=A0A8J4M478_9BACL|nr:NADH-quinone oxidoreductase subunit L [Xylanibacillus composti]MDT9725979.1 NADH-quinone oxidoreductase subunit L [Xylanibacillus composti]GIQ70867.1 NADH-quinone oxidoreductase subunit L [Xylanibacillus composti]
MEFTHYAWLIPVFPLLAFLVLTALGRQMKGLATGFSVLAAAAAFVMAVLVFTERLGENVVDYTWDGFKWIGIGDFALQMGFEVNNLNTLMLVVVTLVSFLVNLYSLGYMKEDERINTFFAYVSLFTFSMLGLVLSINLVQFFIFWELVGVCSFLLVGFWYTKPAAKAAAKKAFIVTRIGDVGLFLGMLLLFWNMPGHSLEFSAIHNAAHTGALSAGVITAAAILVFIGAVGKSGQFPLHTWLPDAMEGPTPISALIHAATMVAAGVYLVARTFPLFQASDAALLTVAIVGGFTAIFAATIALAQNDIKRILAYSTVSQLGYMMLAMGIGTLSSYTAGMFHLYTHAFFKALLFLGAGSVIHAVHEQDIRKMGGLGSKMKITMLTFAIGTLALSGIVPFAGFWSKDAILTEAYHYQPILFWIALVAAFFTALYMARLFFLVFTGKPRSDMHPHESPAVMTVPLIVLAILAVIAGFVYFPGNGWFGEWLTGENLGEHADMTVMILSTVAGVGGLLIGWLLYGRRSNSEDWLEAKALPVYRVLNQKYYVDEAYDNGVVKPLRGIGYLLDLFDRYIVDGAVRALAGVMTATGRIGLRMQNGQLQSYGLIGVIGLLILIVAVVGRRYFHVG